MVCFINLKVNISTWYLSYLFVFVYYILSIMHCAEFGSRGAGSSGALEQEAGRLITYILSIMHCAEVGSREQGSREHWSTGAGSRGARSSGAGNREFDYLHIVHNAFC